VQLAADEVALGPAGAIRNGGPHGGLPRQVAVYSSSMLIGWGAQVYTSVAKSAAYPFDLLCCAILKLVNAFALPGTGFRHCWSAPDGSELKPNSRRCLAMSRTRR